MANVYHIVLGIRSIIKTYSVRLHTKDCFRTQMLLLWQLWIEMLGFWTVFLAFVAANFLCFRGNRVNIHGVPTDKATRKSVHKFWRNLQFPFWRVNYTNDCMCKISWFSPINSERKKNPIHVPIVQKIHHLEWAQYAF